MNVTTKTMAELFAGTVPAFQAEITRIAASMGQDALTVYAAWRRYTDASTDQSAILGEFEDQYRAGHWASLKQQPILRLCCCVCGATTEGRQWWNRDAGFGLCPACAERLGGQETEHDMRMRYGYRGVHYALPEA